MLDGRINALWAQSKILRMGMRLIVVILLLNFCLQAYEAYTQQKAFNYLLLLAAELITVGLVIFSRDTKKVNLSVLSIFATIGGTFYYIFFDFFNCQHVALISPIYGIFIQSLGIVMQIFSKMSLGFSFGLAPANRGVKINGAYGFVRHPIYASYLIAHIGFILSFFSIFNVLVLIFNWICQIIRIFEEEKVLKRDENYLNYSCRVRWRLIPGLF